MRVLLPVVVLSLLMSALITWFLAFPWFVPVTLLVLALAIGIPAALAGGKRESYPYDRSAYYAKEARLRRAQLRTSVARLRMREPFYRLLSGMIWTLAVTLILWLAYMVLAAYLWTDLEIIANVWLYYVAVIVELATIIVILGLHKWVKRHEPKTMKVQVGHSPLLISDFTPGTYTDSVDLLMKDGTKETVPVELIPWGTVKNVSSLVAPIRGVIVARRLNWIEAVLEHVKESWAQKVLAAVENAELKKALRRIFDQEAAAEDRDPVPRYAGRQMGLLYKIPCKPRVYIKGDMTNWREYNWAGLVEKHFPGSTHDFTPIILALDPHDPYSWEAPPEQVTLERELYESRARVKQLTRRHQDYVQQDGVTRSFQEDTQ